MKTITTCGQNEKQTIFNNFSESTDPEQQQQQQSHS